MSHSSSSTTIVALVAEVSIRHIFGRDLLPEHCAALHEYEKAGGNLASLIGTIGRGKLLAEYRKEHPRESVGGRTIGTAFEELLNPGNPSSALLIASLTRMDFVLFGVPITKEEAIVASKGNYHRSTNYTVGKKTMLDAYREACKHPDVKKVIHADPDYFVRLDRHLFRVLNESRGCGINERL